MKKSNKLNAGIHSRWVSRIRYSTTYMDELTFLWRPVFFFKFSKYIFSPPRLLLIGMFTSTTN